MRFTSSTILSLSTLALTASAQSFIMPLENTKIEDTLNNLLKVIPACSYDCLFETSNLASVFQKGSPCSSVRSSDKLPDYIFNSGIKCACDQIDFEGVMEKWQTCVKARDSCVLDKKAVDGVEKIRVQLIDLCEKQPATTNVTVPGLSEPGKNQTNNGTNNGGPKENEPKENEDDSGSATLTASFALMGLGLSAVMALGL